jgi:hypothetical protein
MITDFDDFVTWMFVIVDDLWRGIASLYRRPGPDPSSCSDSELITVALISECRSWDRETQALQEWAAYRHLFPRLPERSRFNRRRRNLMGAIKAIRQIIETVNGQLTDQFAIERNYAHSFGGLCARLYTKLTAHTLCLYLNRLLGNPDWLQIKGLAFPQSLAG